MSYWRRPIGQVYTGIISAVAVSAAQDIFEIASPATTRVRIREIKIGQYSDAGDAAAELLSVQLIVGHTTTGSGGSTVTTRNVNRASTVTAGSTVKANNTTIAANGTAITLYSDVWNIQSGWWYAPGEPEMIVLDISSRLVVRSTVPADAITMNATIVFEEIGKMAV
jgi:hypothetical protein